MIALLKAAYRLVARCAAREFMVVRSTALALLATFFVVGADAQVIAEPLPGDPHLVVFPYDENNSFRVLARPMAVTDIVLEADEKLKVLVLGDTLGWQSAKNGNHVFIKPIYEGRSTSGTLITNKRSYQLMLISTNEAGRWYQRVSFQFPDLVAAQETEEDRARLDSDSGADDESTQKRAGGAKKGDGHQVAAQTKDDDSKDVDASSLNFNYKIKGDAEFKPLNVYDDGHSTYIKLRKSEDMPALFRIKKVNKKEAEAELVDYSVRFDDTLVIPRILDAGMLKIGKEEVVFYNLNRVKVGFFGSIDLGE
jgi:type IV secretory pathway VirB9-like protein